MKALVVAACNGENTDWTKSLASEWMLFIDRTKNPLGRDAYVYLDWIVHYYRDLPDEVAFAQGNPFDHDPNFLANLANPEVRWYGWKSSCNGKGLPQWETNLDAWCDVFELPRQISYVFIAGAQYRVAAEQIRNRSLSFWTALLKLTEVNHKTPWDYERLWPLIYGIEL